MHEKEPQNTLQIMKNLKISWGAYPQAPLTQSTQYGAPLFVFALGGPDSARYLQCCLVLWLCSGGVSFRFSSAHSWLTAMRASNTATSF